MTEPEKLDEINIVPKKVFIVPYRNRIQHKFFFSKYMSFILEDDNDYEIFFSHQCDSRTFNRGATKNIGFIAARNKYPNDYKDITFILLFFRFSLLLSSFSFSGLVVSMRVSGDHFSLF